MEYDTNYTPEENLFAVQVQDLLNKAGDMKIWSKAQNGRGLKESTYRLTKGNMDVFTGNYHNLIKFLRGVVILHPASGDQTIYLVRTA